MMYRLVQIAHSTFKVFIKQDLQLIWLLQNYLIIFNYNFKVGHEP